MSSVYEIQADIQTAMKLIAEKHNAVITLAEPKRVGASLRYSFTLDQKRETAHGEITGEEALYRANAQAYGLKPEWFNTTFVSRGHQYRIAGLLPGRTKNSVRIIRTADQKGFVCPPSMVLNNMPK